MDTIVTTWWATWDYLQSVPYHSWVMLAAGVLTLPVVSVAVEAIKRWHFYRQGEALAKRAVVLWLSFASFAVVALQAFTIYGTTNPKFLGERTFEVVGAATVLYHLLLSIRYKKLSAALTKWVANGRAVRTEITTANTSAPTPPNTEAPQANQDLLI